MAPDVVARATLLEFGIRALLNRAEYGFQRHVQIGPSMNGQTEREHCWHRAG
jgi:hypothetical protein